MDGSDALYCAHNKRCSGAGEPTYGKRVKTPSEHETPQGVFRCRGGGSGCAVYEALGCAPKAAECRHALQPEPTREPGSEPRTVQGVRCLGKDMCVLDACRPEPRFTGEW
ncbi:MAG: hypothetical protein ACYC1U_01010 [Candidatus Aquicultorales bacterium]